MRAARAGDAPAIQRIYTDAGRAAWKHILGPQALAALAPPAHWFGALEDDRTLLLVAELAAEVVGFVDAGPAAEGEALVRAFFTHPSVWGQGVGRALMAETLAQLRERGVRAAKLWTAEENTRPRRFYEQAGWRPDGSSRVGSILGSDFVELGYRIELTSPDPA